MLLSLALVLSQTRVPAPPPIWLDFAPALVALMIGIGINAVVCALLYVPLNAVPQEHRAMEPGLVWLLLIPLFSLVWNFFVFLRISESYQRYFWSVGRYDTGDAGRSLGLWYAICAVVTLVPCLGALAGIAALVLLIVFLVKIWGYRREVMNVRLGGFPVQ